MELDAFQNAWRAFVRRRPFLPFLIELESGERIEIAHPEAVLVKGKLLYFISPRNRVRLFQSSSVCQLLDKHEP